MFQIYEALVCLFIMIKKELLYLATRGTCLLKGFKMVGARELDADYRLRVIVGVLESEN